MIEWFQKALRNGKKSFPHRKEENFEHTFYCWTDGIYLPLFPDAFLNVAKKPAEYLYLAFKFSRLTRGINEQEEKKILVTELFLHLFFSFTQFSDSPFTYISLVPFVPRRH